MKMVTWVLAAGFVLVVAFNFILLNKYKQEREANVYIAEKQEKVSANELTLQENMLFQYAAEVTPCPDVVLKNPKTKGEQKLSELVEGKEPKLFFRFKETDCDVCIQKALRLLKEITTEFPDLPVTILSGYANTRQFYAYANSENKSYEIYNIGSFPVILEEQDKPYFFVLNGSLTMENVYIFTQENNRLSREYLKCMMHKYGYCPEAHDHAEHQ